MNFDGFIANDGIKSRISDAMMQGRLPHAIVLQGERGLGKKTFARLIARALVCRDSENAPCGQCPSCIRALSSSHPDIRIEEGSGASHSISVDTVKELSIDAYRIPEEASFNIYLIFIENKISEISQNKFLKLIEEPPKNTVFIFTCKSVEMLLPTIRSRVETLTLTPPPIEASARYVADMQNIGYNEALKLSELCRGNIGQMLDELQNGDQARVSEICKAITLGLIRANGHEMLEASAPLTENRNRALCGEVLSRLTLIFRDACMLKIGSNEIIGGTREHSQQLCKYTIKRLIRLPEITEHYKQMIDMNVNLTLLITSFCAELRGVLE